jgi:hypothetical protein
MRGAVPRLLPRRWFGDIAFLAFYVIWGQLFNSVVKDGLPLKFLRNGGSRCGFKPISFECFEEAFSWPLRKALPSPD